MDNMYGWCFVKLNYDRKSKDPSYFAQQGIRNGKKVTTKNIFKIGKHSELLAQGHADPLAYAKQVVKEYNEKMKSEKVDLEITIDFNKKLVPTNFVSSKSTFVNIGYFFLQDIYSRLNIKELLNSISKNRKITYNINDINRFLIFDRILEPHSKLATVNNLHTYYENPQFSHQNVLRAMDVLAENYDSYLEHLFTQSNNIVKRDTSVCYYDCTNYYFEIETADKW